MSNPDSLPRSTVFLVSCVGKKVSVPVRARDLYVSEWFARAREYIETSGSPWFILSAKYGLVSPDDVLEPYEQSLNQMKVDERHAWAARVQAQMEERLPKANRIVILAGRRYRS